MDGLFQGKSQSKMDDLGVSLFLRNLSLGMWCPPIVHAIVLAADHVSSCGGTRVTSLNSARNGSPFKIGGGHGPSFWFIL